VGNNGETLVADSSTSTGLRYTSNFAAGKNKILNSDYSIWQRGTTFTSSGYTADRWYMDVDTSSASTSRQTFTPGTAPVAGYEGQYFLRFTRGTGGSFANIQQRIEDVRTFAGQTVTLSFWAKASATTTIEPYYIQIFGSGGSGAVSASFGTSTTLTTSWVRYSYTVAIPSVSGKTIGTGSYLNILTARITGGTNVDVDTWGVQIEAGSVATAFQTATGTIQGELAACQRYYIRFQGTGGAYTQFGLGWCYSTTQANFPILLPVQMRTSPTAVEYHSSISINYYAIANFALTALTLTTPETSPNIANIISSGSSGLTQYRVAPLMIGGNTAGYLAFTAEL
jgi:hypothetical protein